ncbi:MAG: aromatic amino acid lyase [Chitinophagales bacterium]|nr:aromatic amino acid lyase [Chitinophagales bacterium]
MITIGENELSIKDVYSILFEEKKIQLSEEAIQNVNNGYEFLIEFSKGKLIYGINTGFGPMAQYKIADKDLKQLQLNLIRSHSSGTGALLDPIYVKAAMIARLSSFMKGFSGVHKEMVELLKDIINKNITPCIYEHGGVGASGDLVQLAHLALTLIGEGEVNYKGKISVSSEVFSKENIQPLTIHKREGIAVMNGTSVMTGIGLLNAIYARKIMNWSVIFSSMINELVEAFDDHFSEELNKVKNHSGQQKVANAMRQLVQSSQLIKKRSDHLYQHHKIAKERMDEKVQEYYSIRCVPQIVGPVLDTINNAEKVLVDELNSVNDNPVIDVKNQNIFHGGNFHGDYVSLEMDKLKIAVTKLSILAERQLNYLINNNLNEKLTPFINLGKLGLNFGVQGLQFTATSTVAESQMLSNPMYVHSIPNNNDNQDVVSMGTNAALITKKVIENAFEVMSIHAIAVTQAIDYLKYADKLSEVSFKTYSEIRAICPVIIEDKPLYKNIALINQYLKDKKNNLL